MESPSATPTTRPAMVSACAAATSVKATRTPTARDCLPEGLLARPVLIFSNTVFAEQLFPTTPAGRKASSHFIPSSTPHIHTVLPQFSTIPANVTKATHCLPPWQFPTRPLGHPDQSLNQDLLDKLAGTTAQPKDEQVLSTGSSWSTCRRQGLVCQRMPSFAHRGRTLSIGCIAVADLLSRSSVACLSLSCLNQILWA